MIISWCNKVCLKIKNLHPAPMHQKKVIRISEARSNDKLLPILGYEKSIQPPQENNINRPKSSIINSLNNEQKEAVMTTEGYVRVIAGAGSGKTRALTHRFAYLVQELGISPNSIMCVTFTNKAAWVMKSRIRSLIGDQDTAFISTFHGFCVRVLKDSISTLTYPKNFSILDEIDQKSLLSEIYNQLGLTSRDLTYRKALDNISKFKKENESEYIRLMTEPDALDLRSLLDENISNIELVVIIKYLLLQRRNFALDFDDLIEFTLYIFETKEEILKIWQNKLMYIQVDEFQDVSRRQYKLVTLLSKIHNNLFIVGDPDQTIYSWRGANVNYIVKFNEKFPNVKTIFMIKNYRSSPGILSVSNSLIQHNKIRLEKDLVPIKEGAVKVLYYHAKNIQDEAEWIANKIKSLEVDLSAVAILYRSHVVSRSVEEALLKFRIDYTVYSGTPFYQRQEIKDVLSYLRLIVVGDDLSFLRVINTPKRGIGSKRLELIKEYSEKNGITLYDSFEMNINHNLFQSTKAREFLDVIKKLKNSYFEVFSKDQSETSKLVNLIDEILKMSGYEAFLMLDGDQERLDNVAELKNSILSIEKQLGEKFDVEDYLSQVALLTSQDLQENKRDMVKLMTVHSAKGLEFPYVFVCGLNEGVFPSSRVRTPEALEEERRLAYVAFTRAEEALYLTDSEGFNYDNSMRIPSRFIFNIRKDLLDRQGDLDSSFEEGSIQWINSHEKSLNSDQIEISVGDEVNHPTFGYGRVMCVDEMNSEYEIKFDKFSTSRLIKKNFHGLVKKGGNS